MLAFSIDYYGVLFRATQSVGLFCTYVVLAFFGHFMNIKENYKNKEAYELIKVLKDLGYEI